jgi:hypothetical protein
VTGPVGPRRFGAAIGLTMLAAAGCMRVAPGELPPVQTAGMSCRAQTVARLYFGTQMPGGVVDDAAWEAFVSSVIAPRFAAGFTVLDSRGQWRGADGQVVSERSRVLEVVADDDLATRSRLAEVVAAYKQRFRQEAVLLTQSAARACL